MREQIKLEYGAEKSNFKIQPEKPFLNSETKQIGEHKGKGIENLIDQEDLKRSHMPFSYQEVTKMNRNGPRTQSVISSKSDYLNVKNSHMQSKIPFSPF